MAVVNLFSENAILLLLGSRGTKKAEGKKSSGFAHLLGVKLQLDGILFFSRHEILFLWLIVTARSEKYKTSQAMRGKNPKFQLSLSRRNK